MGRNRKKPVRHRLEKRQKRSRQKKKSGLFDKVTMVILVVAVCVFAFSLYQLVRTMVPYYSGGKEYDKLKNKAITVQEQTDDPGDVYRYVGVRDSRYGERGFDHKRYEE